jgi:uncharacterized protein YbjT (DUF2867 family)
MSKVLVTGGAGFIGSFTVDLLVDKGYDVVVMDNYEYQVHLGRRPDYLNGKAKYIDGDVRHEKHWMRALEGVDHRSSGRGRGSGPELLGGEEVRLGQRDGHRHPLPDTDKKQEFG